MAKQDDVVVATEPTEDPKKGKIRLHSVNYSYEGPIPPPHLLAEYEKIVPGSANKIISMAEKQSEHRQFLEKKVIQSNVDNEKAGMNYAFILTIFLGGIGAALIFTGRDIQGFITLLSIVGFQIINYFLAKKKSKKSLEDKKGSKK